MCMILGCNPQIHFFVIFTMNLVILGLKAHIHWISCECKSSYSFTWTFFLKKTLLLFLSRSEVVHVIGYDIFFFLEI